MIIDFLSQNLLVSIIIAGLIILITQLISVINYKLYKKEISKVIGYEDQILLNPNRMNKKSSLLIVVLGIILGIIIGFISDFAEIKSFNFRICIEPLAGFFILFAFYYFIVGIKNYFTFKIIINKIKSGKIVYKKGALLEYTIADIFIFLLILCLIYLLTFRVFIVGGILGLTIMTLVYIIKVLRINNETK